MSIRKNFGKELQKLRELSGLSQEELAEKIGVSRNTISRAETGRNLPNPKNLEKIQRYLNFKNCSMFKNDKLSNIIEKLSLIDDDEQILDFIYISLDAYIKNKYNNKH